MRIVLFLKYTPPLESHPLGLITFPGLITYIIYFSCRTILFIRRCLTIHLHRLPIMNNFDHQQQMVKLLSCSPYHSRLSKQFPRFGSMFAIRISFPTFPWQGHRQTIEAGTAKCAFLGFSSIRPIDKTAEVASCSANRFGALSVGSRRCRRQRGTSLSRRAKGMRGRYTTLRLHLSTLEL